ncbi:hypothetical protein HMPREF3038_03279 [Akkermansia sp. KLE1797]|nr:hypothetical protein HMPREF3038_03279 [Akkermansia sp. KLE1797]KXU55106.1 hypothetical protein HMPREF3039_00659 [Akkermansia sp. KLE1798]
MPSPACTQKRRHDSRRKALTRHFKNNRFPSCFPLLTFPMRSR